MAKLGTVVVVGVGLIGGSVGMAIRARGLADRVIGVGRSGTSLDEALRVGAVDEASTDLKTVVAGADIVVVSTPVAHVVEAARVVGRWGSEGALVTDAGSTKRGIVEEAEEDERVRRVFVGAHPIAGSERKGAGAADAELFEGRVCVLTPTARTPGDRLERATSFWASLGCRVVQLDPTTHDESMAFTSHLPHAVASALAATVPKEKLGLAAGAFRDGTRVAASDAELWTGIFRSNRGSLLEAVAQYQGRLDAFRDALQRDDEAAMLEWWRVGREHRTAFQDVEGRPAVEH